MNFIVILGPDFLLSLLFTQEERQKKKNHWSVVEAACDTDQPWLLSPKAPGTCRLSKVDIFVCVFYIYQFCICSLRTSSVSCCVLTPARCCVKWFPRRSALEEKCSLVHVWNLLIHHFAGNTLNLLLIQCCTTTTHEHSPEVEMKVKQFFLCFCCWVKHNKSCGGGGSGFIHLSLLDLRLFHSEITCAINEMGRLSSEDELKKSNWKTFLCPLLF